MTILLKNFLKIFLAFLDEPSFGNWTLQGKNFGQFSLNSDWQKIK
jgi:hypothetical protein